MLIILSETVPRLARRGGAWLLIALAASAGCSNSPAETSSDPAEPASNSNVEMIQRAMAAARQNSAKAADEARPAPADEPTAAQDTFEPPFPDRHELFLPPASVDPEIASAASRRLNGVMLKGFVRVDGLRALVDVGGELMTLKEGDEQSGVRVVSIQPPEATFQRGEQQWKLSLWGDLDRLDPRQP